MMMKKVFIALLAVAAIALTSCKFDNAHVTVSVIDEFELPVANRAVFYTDKASLIIGAVLPPTPEELIGLGDSSWEYVTTNQLGYVTFDVLMGVSKMKYYFIVYDEGTRGWKEKEVELQRGKNEEIVIAVKQ